MNPNVDTYLIDGCGRCKLYATPECKVHAWKPILIQLRRIMNECGLEEDFKWSQPCYTNNGKNILVIAAFKHYAALAFFKGALLRDPEKILISAGENSQAMRQIRFTDAKEVVKLEPTLKAYVFEAIAVEEAGLKINYNKKPAELPEELTVQFKSNPAFKAAFDSLTPGRQRGYILHFSAPKQSETRTRRIMKYYDKIMDGKGLND
ncbi:MAG: YdeI/OmpD-associated family protein [Flavobacteriales bacterium]|nr:YdeI/OmpD-associated family protein [Flavobacteriales bacterium]